MTATALKDLMVVGGPILGLLGGVFCPGIAEAQTYEGARLLGLGDSQRALTTGNDSIYINPAGIALGRMYSLELGYLDDARGSDRRFNASVIDSQAGAIAGGIAYTYSKRRPDQVTEGDERISGHRVEVALATRVGDTAALGVTARYLNYDREVPEGQAPSGEDFATFTIDAGLQWRIIEQLSIGLAAYNLTNSERKELPIGWGAGLGLELGAFTIEGDCRYNAQIGKARWSGGAGYVVAEMVPLRAGVSYDLENQAWVASGGIGAIFDRFNIDLGYRQRINTEGAAKDKDERIVAAAIRMTFF
jgi:predicted porin